MTKLLDWFRNNQTEITWWIIGWMCFACVDSLVREHYVTALVDGLLAYFNYYMWKQNRV